VGDPNRALFETAVRLLAPMLDELVFVGGSTTGLFLTDPMSTGVRATRDIDAIVDVTTYSQYARLSERLLALGLAVDDSPGAPMCRWRHAELLVDVMPTREDILGFTNRWYPTAIKTADTITVAGLAVRIVRPPLFIATKLEAFRGRGRGDVVASHDLEDVVTVIDGRPELNGEIKAAPRPVREYIAAALRELLANPDFVEALPGFLLPDAASQARRPLIERRMNDMTLL